MKNVLLFLAFMCAISAFAEPSFEQMQKLIEQRQYAAAEQGLEAIIAAHPNSAKAYYSMAQAQAGLGHLDKAQLALNKARGFDPELKFVSSGNVAALEQAITPQVAKIEKVEESHFLRNSLIGGAVLAVGGFGFIMYRRRKLEQEAEAARKAEAEEAERLAAEERARQIAEWKPLSEIKESTKKTSSRTTKKSTTYVDPTPAYIPSPTQSVQAAQPSVVNNYNSSSSSDMVTGMMIGSMMNNHDHTRVIEREVVVERPVYREPTPVYESTRSSYNKSWDDDSSSKASSRSSSWEDDSSSKSSSSWSSSSSSDSSSSWSSSSSDSSSSWSSSDSSSSSSSDW